MSSRRTVAVLGPIPGDHITTHCVETLDQYGSEVCTAAALSALPGPDDRVCPILHVRRQDEEPIKELLAPLPNIDVTGIRSESDRGDLVELSYLDQNKRVERQAGVVDPILPEDVEFVLDADAFVCVPITNYAVGQATLAYIKQHCGDSFAAGMAFGYLEAGDYVAACRYGSAMGAQRCSGSQLSIYRPLKETRRQIQRAYGEAITHMPICSRPTPYGRAHARPSASSCGCSAGCSPGCSAEKSSAGSRPSVAACSGFRQVARPATG